MSKQPGATIRRAREGDAQAIAEIHVASWQAAYRGIVPDAHLDSLSIEKRRDYWADAIAKAQPSVFVADAGAGMAGWVAVESCRDPDAMPAVGEVWAIYVAPEQWGRGLGRALLARGFEELRARGFSWVTLWVLARNARGCRFYSAAGLQPQSSKTITVGGATLEEIRYAATLD